MIDDDRQRLKRQLQAEFTARLGDEFQDENLVMVGDFNAFQINDGFVDVMGRISGRPTPSDQVVLASPDLVDPDLDILVNGLPALFTAALCQPSLRPSVPSGRLPTRR